jgi:transposase
MTRFKIARAYFANNYSQKEIANSISCHKNTINNIISKYLKKDQNMKFGDI